MVSDSDGHRPYVRYRYGQTNISLSISLLLNCFSFLSQFFSVFSIYVFPLFLLFFIYSFLLLYLIFFYFIFSSLLLSYFSLLLTLIHLLLYVRTFHIGQLLAKAKFTGGNIKNGKLVFPCCFLGENCYQTVLIKNSSNFPAIFKIFVEDFQGISSNSGKKIKNNIALYLF